jgi:hypothetical protein
MRVAVSVNFIVYVEVPEGVSLQDVRNKALGEISDGFDSKESFDTPQGALRSLIQNSVKLGVTWKESVEVSIQEVEPVE